MTVSVVNQKGGVGKTYRLWSNRSGCDCTAWGLAGAQTFLPA
jgi:hypothetical protein